MKYVKITHGYYGAKEGNIIKAKGKNDKPFPLPDEEADRIVSLGIAEYADARNESADVICDVAEILEYDDNTSMPALKAIAKREGIKVSIGMTKTELKTLLDEHFADEEDDMPDLTAEEPEL